MRRHKYNAVQTTVDGIAFDSKAESRRYRELLLLQQAGVISGLALQPCFTLQEAFTDRTGVRHRAITYRGDFAYVENGQEVVEDVKGYRNKVFLLKQKLFLYLYPHLELRVTE